MKWMYGVTTVPVRFDDLLPRTLESLAKAGFEQPRLFVDGDPTGIGNSLEISCRIPPIRAYGNWLLGMWELYLRDPWADRYAIFQDDVVTYKNLRQYLEASKYPNSGYLNLYTFPQNHKKANSKEIGWFYSNQRGLSACGLVFDNNAIKKLLNHQHVIHKPQDREKGHKSFDGTVVSAMRKSGCDEYVHNPSLLQHTGRTCSVIGNKVHPLSPSFKGEDFDAMELL